MKLQNLFIALSFTTISFIAFLSSVLGYRPENNVNEALAIPANSPSFLVGNTTDMSGPIESISQLLNSLQQQRSKLDEQMQQGLLQTISNILHNSTSTGYGGANSGLLGYNGNLN
ncbi:hypothetical protein cand_036100 [Cryptosporidium andersoni]|uniref:Uncharacterized protein n=1 Tax=Cryptosporidium andersoni TaxID=117008 RepID=A0A1J4MVT3_9CRYT|nr:hypothetical protein cand_036100 [Cryptosporidium andersoni]